MECLEESNSKNEERRVKFLQDSNLVDVKGKKEEILRENVGGGQICLVMIANK